jgi:DNA primase
MSISNNFSSTVQKIKEILPIEDVISSYVKLEKSGANFKARCPFHNEKTPSFYISPSRNGYYCFGCGAKGDIFTFVEQFEGLDFKGALKILAERAGVVLDVYKKDNINNEEKESLYKITEEACVFFVNNLNKNNEALSYLKSRGLEQKTIKEFRIGFALADWQALFFYLKNKGYKEEIIEKAGLAKKSDKNESFYDRFRVRIIFPIFDSSGRVIAFSGRLFIDDGKSAKYLNSPETPIFSKASVLYGLDKAKETIRKNNFSILVEGQIDLVLSHQAGFRNTIASSGTAFSDAVISKENATSNLGLLLRLSNNIILAFDSDKAGENASFRAGKMALALGMNVKVASIPTGNDPADVISKQGVDAWREAVRNSKSLIEFLVSKILLQNKDNSLNISREIKNTVLPFLVDIDSAIEKNFFIKKIYEMTNIPESVIVEDLKKIPKEPFLQNVNKKNISELLRKDYIERRLLGIILWQRSLGKETVDTGKYLKDLCEILEIPEDTLLDQLEKLKEDFIFEAEVFYGDSNYLEKDIKELLSNLKEEKLKNILSTKMNDLNKAENEKDSVKIQELLMSIDVLNKEIEQIKNSR